VIAPDFAETPEDEAVGRAVESLGEAAELAGSFGVRLALEFPSRGRFCASLDTAVAMVEQVGSAHLGVCLDVFHYYTGPSKFEDLGHLRPENLAWVQVSDLSATPREVATDADRVLPGDGDFQLGPILEHLARVGYGGGVSLEALNPMFWSIPADRVADVGFQALERTLRAAGVGVAEGSG
jgi:sugar phosphate isomerase/epimerase